MIDTLLQPYRNSNITILEKAYLIRQVETAFLELFQEGLLRGTVHTCVGQELSALAICNYINQDDFVVSNHRGHGHFIAHTNNVTSLISELLGKSTGASKGIGGSQHLFDKNFLSNGIQGNMAPVAAGIAYAEKLNSKNNIVVIFIGDGTLGEGSVYETLNLISLFNLPLLVVLEDNNIAQSTPQEQYLSGTIQGRAIAFGIEYLETSTEDVEDLFKKASKAVNFVKKNKKPAFCHIKTSRLNAHSKGDDTRDPHLLNSLKKKDVLNKCFDLKDTLQIKHRVDNLVNEIVENAKRDQETSKEELNNSSQNLDRYNFSTYEVFASSDRVNKRIRDALRYCLSSNKKTILLGEDIQSPYGGAFKTTDGLSLYYPDRVKNTPISELAITGLANGLALRGMRPFVEIMFGDFSTLIVDQILNGSVKFKQMFGGQIECPVKIRMPMGAGGGYGPTHSQSLEKLFLTIDGLDIVAINRLVDPIKLYKQIQLSDNPTLIIEHKSDYTKYFDLAKMNINSFMISDENYPTIVAKPKKRKPNLTIITYGANAETAFNLQKKLFLKDEKFAQVVVFTKITDISKKILDFIIDDVNEVIIIEDGTTKHGWGSDLIASISSLINRKIKYTRLGARHHIIPASYKLEQKVLVSSDQYWEIENV